MLTGESIPVIKAHITKSAKDIIELEKAQKYIIYGGT